MLVAVCWTASLRGFAVLKKRIVGTITVKNGWAVQSIGYRRYLPLGRPEIIAENFDRWGADEIIVICIDRSSKQAGPDFELIRRLGKMGLATPVIYGGGIRTVEDGVEVIKSGADRLCVDALLHDAPPVVTELSRQLGSQAIVGAMPMATERGQRLWLNYRTGKQSVPGPALLDLFSDRLISEVLLIDWKNEGKPAGFDFELIHSFQPTNIPLIVFGGLSDARTLEGVLSIQQVSAAAIGNFLSYREHAIQRLKEQLVGLPLRQSDYSLQGL